MVYDLLRTKQLESQLKAEELTQSRREETCIVIGYLIGFCFDFDYLVFIRLFAIVSKVESEENGNVLISSSSALMTLFTSSSFVFDWIRSVLRLLQTPSLGKTSREVLYDVLWFNFIIGLTFIFLCFKLIIIYYHAQKQRKIKIKPRIKLNHNICVHKLNGPFAASHSRATKETP